MPAGVLQVLVIVALSASISWGFDLTVDMSGDCNQDFAFIEGATESFTLLSHIMYADANYPRATSCVTRFNIEACETTTLNCNVFDLTGRPPGCHLGDHLSVNGKPYCGTVTPQNETFLGDIDKLQMHFRTSFLLQAAGFKCTLTCDTFKRDAKTRKTPQSSSNPPPGCVCGQSDLLYTGGSTDSETEDRSTARLLHRRKGLKVVGGSPALKGEIRWQVALTKSPGRRPIFVFCGGTLLNAKYVMTAAHCTAGKAPASMYAIVGMTTTEKPEEGKTIQVLRKFQHAFYNDRTTDNDYSILELSEAVDFTDPKLEHVSPICWPSGRPAPNENVLISGWGTLSSGGSAPKVLQLANVNVVRSADCNSFRSYPGQISRAMLCAGVYPNGGVDTCQGDSGGPLVTRVGDNYELVGATSWGRGCAGRYLPGVYADIRHVFTWVREVAHEGECPRTMADASHN